MNPAWTIREGEEFKVIRLIWMCGLKCYGTSSSEPLFYEIFCTKENQDGEIVVILSKESNFPKIGLLVQTLVAPVQSPKNTYSTLEALHLLFNKNLDLLNIGGTERAK
jgi:hypothetical protein